MLSVADFTGLFGRPLVLFAFVRAAVQRLLALLVFLVLLVLLVLLPHVNREISLPP